MEMTVPNIMEAVLPKPTPTDNAPKNTGDQGFSSEMKKADESQMVQQPQTEEPEAKETPVVDPAEEMLAQLGQGLIAFVAPEMIAQPQDAAMAEQPGVTMVSELVMEQPSVQSNVETLQSEPGTQKTQADVKPSMGEEQKFVVTDEQLVVQEQTLAKGEDPQIKQPVQQVSQKQTDVQMVSDDATQFAQQVLDEANVMLDQQKFSGEKIVVSESVPAITEENVTLKQAAAGEKKQSTAGNDMKETTQPQNTVFSRVAEDGRVDFKTLSEQMPQVEQKEQILSQLVEGVRNTVTKEKTELFLQLKPQHLGGLSILLAAEENGIVAKLVTSNQTVYQTMQSDMEQLQAALRDKGINVVQMEVIYGQMANSTAKDHSGGNQAQYEQANGSHGRIPETVEGATTYYEMLSQYEVLAEQGGSVEFTA